MTNSPNPHPKTTANEIIVNVSNENVSRRARVREHVNPLAKKYSVAIAPPIWTEIYADWSKPLSLDIGSARGRYILQMAQMKPDWNFLGLEIREPLVDRCNEVRDELSLKNLHYIFCNANVSLAGLLPKGSLHEVTIQFPDPWFKRRQQKRRAVQPELVATLAELLVPNADVFLQSDVYDVALDMRQHFEANENFVNLAGAGNFADGAIFPEHIPTERESSVISQGLPVYRAYFKRK
ncbi:tRNA (guanosine(46)-N7)-methyltransferase TrmB [Pseudanabaena sp. UWO310]|uniref:tRNA (guanosine(46)-N7)-methyltransferase TrmB n=1 Tax=Pseudanabaena sp. UWO310 TaxID=2480795 RepID=UPI00115A6AEB|nr:tRNA (guanosine(46)-N7)-methyltransferase TrmB [Pseudanabaena sp. UWO310]TYQ26234.1 tRNA (guanosine(46)-N7)-methyltransferase TrmB [Pseudanabaena sp. UWO310]